MRRLSRLVLIMTATLVLAAPGTAGANEPLPLPLPDKAAEPAPPAGQRARMSTEQRFEAANTTRDGRLTLQQARQGYKSIVRHFETIDAGGKGFVTLDDIRAWQKATRDARQAARTALDDPLRPRSAMQRSPAPAQAVKAQPEPTVVGAKPSPEEQDPDGS